MVEIPSPAQSRTGWPWTEGLRATPPTTAPAKGWPRISIVTPSFNQGPFLEETIRSVLLQNYPNLEFVIIDGGSTDTSVEIITRYAAHLGYWVSETDRGQSQAINKGIARCTGDIFNWINSDDLLLPGTLWAVAEAWIKAPGRIISGHTEFFNEQGTFNTIKARGQTLRNFVRFWEADDWSWAQPGTFVPLCDLKAAGGIREDLKYCLDYHMMVQLLARGIEVTCLNQTFAKFRFHGTSKTVGSREEFRLERVPTLRAMANLSIKVEDWEWEQQQARRLVDVARRALGRGDAVKSARLMGQALLASPTGVFQEIQSRLRHKMGGPTA